jgi:hypothetical protein
MIGGLAECAQVGGSVAGTVCYWVADEILLGFVFSAIPPDVAAGHLREMLTGVVVFG